MASIPYYDEGSGFGFSIELDEDGEFVELIYQELFDINKRGYILGYSPLVDDGAVPKEFIIALNIFANDRAIHDPILKSAIENEIMKARLERKAI